MGKMTRLGKATRLAAVLAAAAFALAACDDDDGGGGGGGGSSGAPQDQFGSTFADAFNASSTDEPIDPAPGDAGQASLTGDPVEF